MLKHALLAASLLLSTTATAEVYKCEKGGTTEFSDAPCGEHARQIEVEPQAPSGISLDTGTDVEFYRPPVRERKDRGCIPLTSTEVNTYAVRDQIAHRMTPANVRRAWGSPTDVYSGGDSTRWTYAWGNGSVSFVYFKDGCVDSFTRYR